MQVVSQLASPQPIPDVLLMDSDSAAQKQRDAWWMEPTTSITMKDDGSGLDGILNTIIASLDDPRCLRLRPFTFTVSGYQIDRIVEELVDSIAKVQDPESSQDGAASSLGSSLTIAQALMPPNVTLAATRTLEPAEKSGVCCMLSIEERVSVGMHVNQLQQDKGSWPFDTYSATSTTCKGVPVRLHVCVTTVTDEEHDVGLELIVRDPHIGIRFYTEDSGVADSNTGDEIDRNTVKVELVLTEAKAWASLYFRHSASVQLVRARFSVLGQGSGRGLHSQRNAIHVTMVGIAHVSVNLRINDELYS